MRTEPKLGSPTRPELSQQELAVEAGERMRTGRPLTKPQLAAWLEVSQRYLEKEVERNRLGAVKTSDRLIRFRPTDVERWLERFATQPAAEGHSPSSVRSDTLCRQEKKRP